jgi:hypothetical protein
MTTRSLAFLGRASTPPEEERVTSFFTCVKKEVTKKESTLRGAPGFTHGYVERLRRSQLRVGRGGVKTLAGCSDQFSAASFALYSRCCLTTALVMAPIQWTGGLRAHPDLQSSSSEAQNNVLSFGDFSLHGQRKVTRSSAGGAEALAPGVEALEPREYAS